jgi:hypothetical protein
MLTGGWNEKSESVGFFTILAEENLETIVK